MCVNYIVYIWTFVELAPLELYHFGKREALEFVDLMEDQFDDLMLFDAALYTKSQASHLKDEEHWDPTQVYGVRGKLPKAVPEALKEVKTQRSEELCLASDFELKQVEGYLRLNQGRDQNLQIVSVRRLFGRLLLILYNIGRYYWAFLV